MARPVVESYASSGYVSGAALHSAVVTKPTGTAEGDLLSACGASGSTSNRYFTAPAGWTVFANIEQDTGGATTYHQVWWKVATGSEGANYTFTQPGSGTGRVFIFRISGAAHPADNAIESTDSITTTMSSITTHPSVTPSDADSLVIRSFAHAFSVYVSVTPEDHTLGIVESDNNMSLSVFWITAAVPASATGTKDFTKVPNWRSGFGHIALAIAPSALLADTRRRRTYTGGGTL